MTRDHNLWESAVDVLALVLWILGALTVFGIAFWLGIPQHFMNN
jgi:hypothetical protein